MEAATSKKANGQNMHNIKITIEGKTIKYPVKLSTFTHEKYDTTT